MSDSASDTSDAVIASPEPRDPIGPAHPHVPSPTLVPSMGPGPKEDFVRRLQEIVAGSKANSKGAAKPAHEASIGLENEQVQPPDRPQEPDAEIGPDDRSQDALELLQALARKSGSDTGTLLTPAAQLDIPLAPSLPVAGLEDELSLAARDAAPQTPARNSRSRRTPWFAIAGCSAILASGVTGLLLWNGMIPAHLALRPATDVTVAAPSERPAAPAVQARPDIQSDQTAMAECGLAASKNPYAAYFLVTPNALGSNMGRTAMPSGEDYGFYSMMSLKSRLERHGAGGGC